MRARSLQGQAFSQRLSKHGLSMQACEDCGRLQYPPQAFCRACLSINLAWQDKLPKATVIAAVAVHRSYADDFNQGGPWWVASVSLGPGINCYAHTLGPLPADSEVHLVALNDRLGDGVLGAVVTLDDESALQGKFNS